MDIFETDKNLKRRRNDIERRKNLRDRKEGEIRHSNRRYTHFRNDWKKPSRVIFFNGFQLVQKDFKWRMKWKKKVGGGGGGGGGRGVGKWGGS